jgi:hypothetical protein
MAMRFLPLRKARRVLLNHYIGTELLTQENIYPIHDYLGSFLLKKSRRNSLYKNG